jgi:hypothetical protein
MACEDRAALRWRQHGVLVTSETGRHRERRPPTARTRPPGYGLPRVAGSSASTAPREAPASTMRIFVTGRRPSATRSSTQYALPRELILQRLVAARLPIAAALYCSRTTVSNARPTMISAQSRPETVLCAAVMRMCEPLQTSERASRWRACQDPVFDEIDLVGGQRNRSPKILAVQRHSGSPCHCSA